MQGQVRRKYNTKEKILLPEAEFLDEIPKVLRVFLLAIHSYLPWDFYFFNLTQPLKSVCSSITIRCKGERKNLDIKTIPLFYGLRNPCTETEAEAGPKPWVLQHFQLIKKSKTFSKHLFFKAIRNKQCHLGFCLVSFLAVWREGTTAASNKCTIVKNTPWFLYFACMVLHERKKWSVSN